MSLIQEIVSGKPLPLALPGLDGVIFHMRYMNGREAMHHASVRRFIESKKQRPVRNLTAEDALREGDELYELNAELLLTRLTKIDGWGDEPLTRKDEMRSVLDALPAAQIEELTLALQDARAIARLLFRCEPDPGPEGAEVGQEEPGGEDRVRLPRVQSGKRARAQAVLGG